MGIHVTSTDWTVRLRRVRRLVSFQPSIPASSGPSSRWLTDAGADGSAESRRTGPHRAANTPLDQREIRRHQLAVLGLDDTATAEDITTAYRRLVSDLTPGPDADHGRVELALAMLEEVNQAYRWLEISAVA